MDLLTKAEVCRIVKKIAEDGDVRLVDYELGKRGEGVFGHLGKHLSLTLNLSSATGDARRKLFLKTFEVRNGKEDFLGETGIFKREQDFYRVVVEDVKKCVGQPDWCPEYLFSKERVLVLEDLSEKGFEMVADGRNSWELDDAHLETALRSLASMHATSLLLEARKSELLPNAYPNIFDVEMLYDEHKQKSSKWDWIAWQVQDLLEGVHYLDKYSSREKTLIENNFEKQIMRIYPLSKKSEKYKNVLTHGDLWKNNLLFLHGDENSPKECKFVDFQFIRYAPPAHDVTHLLHYATRKETRDRTESRYRRLYYQTLKERAKVAGIDVGKHITEEEFVESCKEYKELALIQCLLSLHYILGPVTLNAEAENYEKYEEFLADHRKEYMNKFFHDESYAEKVKDIFYELIETYILKERTSPKNVTSGSGDVV